MQNPEEFRMGRGDGFGQIDRETSDGLLPCPRETGRLGWVYGFIGSTELSDSIRHLQNPVRPAWWYPRGVVGEGQGRFPPRRAAARQAGS